MAGTDNTGFRLGAMLGALGLAMLFLNVGDFLLGFDRVADWTFMVGAALALAGAYLEMENKRIG